MHLQAGFPAIKGGHVWKHRARGAKRLTLVPSHIYSEVQRPGGGDPDCDFPRHRVHHVLTQACPRRQPSLLRPRWSQPAQALSPLLPSRSL